VSGLPFQMGLNLLIAREKPDVILIEPTGLGHPRNILNMLAAEHYQSILELGATICLLDPRHLSQPRYTSNDVFKDQLQVADVLVANKTELTSPADKSAFDTCLSDHNRRKPHLTGRHKVISIYPVWNSPPIRSDVCNFVQQQISAPRH
jgi:G3E family GTPase